MNPVKYKTCEKCNQQFPQTKIIDGKRRILNKRRFCLTCSPFGSHNTRNLLDGDFGTIIKNGIQYKKCRQCNEIKPFDDFYSKSEWGRRYAVCSTCSRKKSKSRRDDFKDWCVKYKGGKCIICGYNKCQRSLDFHHTDPTKKDYIISLGWKKPKEEIKLELDKCDLVCKNCHGEIHDRDGAEYEN